MFSGNWLCKLAVRGFLIGAILVAGSVARSADVTQKPAAETNQSQKAPKDKETTQPLFVPSETQKGSAEDKATDDKADYYAKADLDAQERMATETERLAKLTDSQLTIAIVGAVLLGFTLIAAGVAAGAAWSAARSGKEIVAVTRDSAERQLRAYITLAGITIEWRPGFAICVEVHIKNTGQTPAYGVQHFNKITVGELENPKNTFKYREPTDKPSTIDLGAGLPMKFLSPSPKLESAVYMATKDRSIPIYVRGEFHYFDIFRKEPRHTKYCMFMPVGGENFFPCHEGNESD